MRDMPVDHLVFNQLAICAPTFKGALQLPRSCAIAASPANMSVAAGSLI
jgi:hypothetical protein